MAELAAAEGRLLSIRPAKSVFAPLAQLAEQVTLNYDHRWVISPVLPNTLPKCRTEGTPISKSRNKPAKLLRV